MAEFLKNYGDCEGPLGFPMKDAVAKELNELLKSLPKDDAFVYRKALIPEPPTELLDGERADVSWISTESPDREKEVVISKGMTDRFFQKNPLVALNHDYKSPPVGRSLWRKAIKHGDRHGVKAKTHYPKKPDSLIKDEWPPDYAFALVQAGLLQGKSIGFLPIKVHIPTTDECQQKGWKNVKRVIDEWALLEYSCCFLPMNQEAVVEMVSKADQQTQQQEQQDFMCACQKHPDGTTGCECTDPGVTCTCQPKKSGAAANAIEPSLPSVPQPSPPLVVSSPKSVQKVVGFMTVASYEEALKKRFEEFDLTPMIRKLVLDALARYTGKV